MKLSKYITRVKHGEDILVHSGMTGAALLVEKAKIPEFDRLCETDGSLSDDPLINRAYAAVRSSFKHAMILVEDEIDELQMLEGRYRRAQFETGRSTGLALTPTMECNFACPYCYNPSERASMSEKVKGDIVNFIAHEFLPRFRARTLHIGWVGGEPLYDFDALSDFAGRIYAVSKQNECDLSSSLVTNGSLLTGTIASALTQPPFALKGVQISLDGPKALHDETRVFPDGSSTFDLICGNIQIAREHMNVSVRINVTSKFEPGMLETLRDELAQRGFTTKGPHKVAFYLGRVTLGIQEGSCLFSVPEDQVLSMSDHAKLELVCAKMAKKLGLPFLIGSYTKPRSIGCGLLQENSLTIDAEGYIGKCWNSMGRREEAIGKTSQMIWGNNPTHHRFIDCNPFQDSTCRNCHVLPLCGTGCRYHAMKSGRDSGEACSPAKYNLEDRLRFAYFGE